MDRPQPGRTRGASALSDRAVRTAFVSALTAMRRALVVGAALSVGGVAGAHAEPVRYRFDPTHTFVTFEVSHFGTSTIRGRFGPANGDATLDRTARKGRVQVELDTATVSTGVAVL